MDKITCRLCGYQWIPRTDKPKECPLCKQYQDQRDRPKREKAESEVNRHNAEKGRE